MSFLFSAGDIKRISPRRSFLKVAVGGALVAGSSLFGYDENDSSRFYDGDREIWLLRNGKQLRTVYYQDGSYIRSAYEEICYFLQDVKRQEAVEMDPALFDVVSYSQKWLHLIGVKRPLIATSGYRNPATNEELDNAARMSLHQYGKAIDGWVEGVNNAYLGAVARRVGGGGIGFYKVHLHIDTGRTRHWLG